MSFSRFFLLCASLVVFSIMAGCQADTGPVTLFQDGFEYAVDSPWTPTNGWSKWDSTNWSITAGGESGNALRFLPNHAGSGIMHNTTGSDYTISVRLKMTVGNPGGWPVYVCGRFTDDSHWYGAGVYEDALHDMYLVFVRRSGGDTDYAGEVLVKTGALDPGTWYTLTITCKGTTITGSCSGPGFSQSTQTTFTGLDTGGTGLYIWTGSSPYDLYFDNFMVTTN